MQCQVNLSKLCLWLLGTAQPSSQDAEAPPVVSIQCLGLNLLRFPQPAQLVFRRRNGKWRWRQRLMRCAN